MLGVFLLHDAIVRYQQVAPIPYSDFQRLLREGKVKEVVVTADRIRGELKEPEGGKKRFVTKQEMLAGEGLGVLPLPGLVFVGALWVPPRLLRKYVLSTLVTQEMPCNEGFMKLGFRA